LKQVKYYKANVYLRTDKNLNLYNMKEFFKMFFASLLAMIVAGIVIIIVFIAIIVGLVSKASHEKVVKVDANSVLVVNLEKHFHEQGQSNSIAAFTHDESYTGGLYDMTHAIKYAKTDENVKGILIKLNRGTNGWASLQQLRMALADFKLSRKFVYAYGEGISQGAYFVGSVADSVYLNPVGGFDLKGFATILAFFKGTLDKLEVKPEIFYAGKFKSATEPFRAEKMSEPNREQIQAFQKDIWNEFVQAAAQHTHTSEADINSLTASGAIQFPADAMKYKLVDGLLYWDEMENRLREKTGTKATEDVKYVSMDEYSSKVKYDGKPSDKKIAVVFAEGTIIDGEQGEEYEIAAKTFIETIRKVKKDDKIKAVVLRINSPGGSALASDVILRELKLLKEKKPFIVSMGDYAASGGYYIASEADSIFALPNTITGSIGVFSMLFDYEGLAKNKLGITFDGVKNAPYADVPTFARALNEDESKRMQNSVDNIYEIFKGHVSKGRRISMADVDSIAQGRVWTGTQALKIKLIDGLGNLDRAIKSAAAMANISDYKLSTYPEPADKMDILLHKIKNNTGSESIKAGLKKELGESYEWVEKIKALKDMNGKLMMAMPFVLDVK
jgi:protease-4